MNICELHVSLKRYSKLGLIPNKTLFSMQVIFFGIEKTFLNCYNISVPKKRKGDGCRMILNTRGKRKLQCITAIPN